MRDQRAFDFCGPQAVARNVDHVIDAAGYPVIAILVTTAAVAGEIFAFIGRKISLLEAVVIAIDRAHLPRPRVGDAQVAAGRAFERLAIGINDFRLDAEKWPRRRARLEL